VLSPATWIRKSGCASSRLRRMGVFPCWWRPTSPRVDCTSRQSLRVNWDLPDDAEDTSIASAARPAPAPAAGRSAWWTRERAADRGHREVHRAEDSREWADDDVFCERDHADGRGARRYAEERRSRLPAARRLPPGRRGDRGDRRDRSAGPKVMPRACTRASSADGARSPSGSDAQRPPSAAADVPRPRPDAPPQT